MSPLVLIVEDDPASLYLATYLLEEAGARVISAGDGATGLQRVAVDKPDVVVMDISLPILDGYEAIRALRENPETATLPVVAATSFAQPEDRERALAEGFTDYMEKPLDVGTFAAQVLKNVKGSAGGNRL